MQLAIFDGLNDLQIEGKKVLIGLSGGINSAATLCYLLKYVEEQPSELHLFYAHFEEHSPETEKFVHDLVEYAKSKHDNVTFKQTNNSVLDFFEAQKFIPHPTVSPCTRVLKILPIFEYMNDNEIDIDLVGYIRSEKSRIKRQIKSARDERKEYLISHLSDQDCFDIVKSELGWFPSHYEILWTDKRIMPFIKRFKEEMGEAYEQILDKHKKGYGHRKQKRIFAHNNCLPCKNMNSWEYWMVRLFYPKYYEKAVQVAKRIEAHWGRSETDMPTSCTYCEF